MNTNLQTLRSASSITVSVVLVAGLLGTVGIPRADAAGLLTPIGSQHRGIQIRDHHVNVVINNGFAQTEVIQTFYNPNAVDLEAIYSFPVPNEASLSEVTIYIGEEEIDGEVLPKDEARNIYEEEKKSGNDSGLAEKNGYQTYDFSVSPVRAQSETRLRFVYYQRIEIDTGVGRYVYPLEDGGTDEVGASFWMPNETVEDTLSIDLELKCAYPVDDVRVPGFEAATTVDEIEEGHYRVKVETQGASLNRDFIFYYRLQDNQPARVELMAYREDSTKAGTYMMVVTPGLDLQPITNGADYTFVLDVSGSMRGKIHTLARAVSRAIGELRPDDRFRIVTFNTRATDLTRGWIVATADNVHQWTKQCEALRAQGSTNLYEGISMALDNLDDDRATSIVLVTDAVTNTGVIDPKSFYDLLQQYDVRLFGFLMGNNSNWPLMRLICETSGGFWASVSNADDIIGQIMLAKSKITHESLHDAKLTISGVNVFEDTGSNLGKVYRGQQVVLFGRYDQGGTATVMLEARLTGEDQTYTTTFDFPEIDTENPEIERLWAMNRIEAIEMDQMRGVVSVGEGNQAIEDLGVAYQLVTDHTSMLILSDASFSKRGIERRNRQRTVIEHQAQARRRSQPARDNRVDRQNPMFNKPAPSPRPRGGGGGALDPITGGLAICLAGLACAAGRRKRKSKKGTTP